MKKEVKVGLLVVISATLLYLGFNYLKGEDFFTTDKKYYVVYDNIDGLTVSNPVVVNGYAVGRIDEIEILHDSGDSLKVHLSVESGIELGDGTRAMLADDGLLGAKQIQLILNPNKIIYGGGERLTGTKERSLAGKLQEKAVPVIESMDSVLIQMHKMLNDSVEKSLTNTMKNLEATTAALKVIPGQISGMVKNGNRTLDTLSAEVAMVAKSANSLIKEISPLMVKLNQFADTLNDLELKKMIASLNSTVTNLDGITSKINKGEGTIGKLMTDDKLYKDLNKAILEIDSVFDHFDHNPKHFLKPLGKKGDDPPYK